MKRILHATEKKTEAGLVLFPTLFLILLFCLLQVNTVISQCLTASYGQYPGSAFTPACSGSSETITTVGYAGEYSVVSVISGNNYIFTSSVGSDYITVSNAAGTIAYAWGTTPVNWVATYTGTVRFYTHTNSSCGESGTSRTRSVTCTAAPSYCAAGATTCDEYISRVQTGTIDNSTACTAGGYANYTGLSTIMNIGTGYAITVTNGLPYSSDQCGIWVDWNQDMDFADANETITITGTPGNGPYTATITPPAGAILGNTRMRIRICYTTGLSSCGTASYGEVEDYTINVQSAGCTTPGTPITLTGTSTGQTTANLSWAAGAPAGSPTITYYWEAHLNATDALVTSGSTGALSAGATGLTCNTTYHFHVRAYTSCNATYSAWAGPSATFTTSACVAGPCGGVIGIAGCGAGNSRSVVLNGAGAWNTSFCGFSVPGNEQIYSYVAPSTGTYSIQVTAAAGGYIDYGWQATSCAQTGWTCIDDISTTGTYGSMTWTAGTTYYLLLDGEATSVALSGTFYINCPVATPVNNDCPGTNLTPGVACAWTAGTTAGATETMAGCTGTANDDVWYNFVATQPNYVIDVSGNGDFDAVVELFSGNCGSLVSVTHASGAQGGGVESIEATGLTPGNTYYIRVYHYYATAPANSTFNICVYNYADVCGDFVCGPTESCVTCPGDCGTCPEPVGGPYIHGTDGLQGTYVANCMVNTCSGNYYDNGGAAGNYPNNEGSQPPSPVGGWYRTFCPTAANQCLRATFTAMDIEESGGGCYDFLAIRNGSTQLSPYLWRGCRTLATPRTINGAWSNPITASSLNGCLTFEFYSDFSTQRPGWAISFSCVACATSPDNNDCETATPVCGSISFAGNSDGPGLTSTCSGCVLSENYTNWYYFEIASSGRLSLTIDPIFDSDDYDFALYQASSCATLGSPVRCSYAMNTGNTGMDVAYSDVSEDVGGDAWVDALNVTAGESYFLMINKWSAGGSGFNITGNLTGGGALVDCGLLPIELISFDAYKKDKNVEIKWSTASETNNDYFTVLKSFDANLYKPVAQVFSMGSSNTPHSYSVIDEEPLTQTTYYRLKQTDKDGKFSYSDVKVVNPSNDFETLNSLNAYFVNLTQEIVVSFNGLPGENYSYFIYDMTGRQIKNGIISANNSAKGYVVINSQEISQGIYSIVLKDKITLLQQKIIITK